MYNEYVWGEIPKSDPRNKVKDYSNYYLDKEPDQAIINKKIYF